MTEAEQTIPFTREDIISRWGDSDPFVGKVIEVKVGLAYVLYQNEGERIDRASLRTWFKETFKTGRGYGLGYGLLNSVLEAMESDEEIVVLGEITEEEVRTIYTLTLGKIEEIERILESSPLTGIPSKKISHQGYLNAL